MPNLRWMAAHRMQRNTPNCIIHQWQLRSRGDSDKHTLHDAQAVDYQDVVSGWHSRMTERDPLLTGIARLTIRTETIARHIADQVLKCLFVPRSLALAQGRGHRVGQEVGYKGPRGEGDIMSLMLGTRIWGKTKNSK